MFESLSLIDWSKLSHACGNAADVPEMLGRLAADSQEERLQAGVALWSAICHQGSRLEATVEAIPFLIEACASPQILDKDSILLLLAEIGELPRPAGPGGQQGESHYHHNDDAEVARRCNEEVGKGLDTFLRLLSEGDLKARVCVTVVLSVLPQHLSKSLARLETIACDESEPELLRISCLLALLALDRERCVDVCLELPLPEVELDATGPVPMLGALVAALQLIAGEALPEASTLVLAGLWRGLEADGPDPFAPFSPVPAFVDPRTRYPWRVEPKLTEAARHLPLSERLKLVALLGSGDSRRSSWAGAALCLGAVFEAPPLHSLDDLPESGIPGSESWNDEQRRVLQAIHDSDGYWLDSGRRTTLLSEYLGFPENRWLERERLEQALAEPARPLDVSRFAEASVEVILKALRSSCRFDRLEALFGLEQRAPLSLATLGRLVACLAREQDEWVREEVGVRMCDYAGARRQDLARMLLEEVCAMGEDGCNRYYLCRCIRRLGWSVLETVVEFMDAHPDLAESLTDALAYDAPELPTVLQLSRHRHPIVRRKAIEYAKELCYRQQTRPLDMLARALSDAKGQVREAARRALESLAGYGPQLGAAMLETLERTGIDWWPELEERLASSVECDL